MSWCVQPQVNGIPYNRRLAIVSARSDVCGATNSTWSDIFIESTLIRYGHSKGGLTGITLNDKAHSLLSCSQLVRNMTNVQYELARTHHLEESNARIQPDNSDRRKLWERQYQCIGRFCPYGHCVTVFIIVSGSLTAAPVHVMNALQIGKACMEAYENKLPQGFYNKISSYVVTMDTPMKGNNMGAVTTVDI